VMSGLDSCFSSSRLPSSTTNTLPAMSFSMSTAPESALPPELANCGQDNRRILTTCCCLWGVLVLFDRGRPFAMNSQSRFHCTRTRISGT
jgi:hypothetical protein